MSPLAVFGLLVGVLGFCIAVLWIVESWSEARKRKERGDEWRKKAASMRSGIKSLDNATDQELYTLLQEMPGNLADLPSEVMGQLSGIYASQSSPATTCHQTTLQWACRQIRKRLSHEPAKRINRPLDSLIARLMGYRSGGPTNHLTVRWLGRLLSATGRERDHGASLQAIKSIRDTEATELAAAFNIIATTVASVTVPVVAFLYAKLTSSHETRSVSQAVGGVTTTTKVYSEPHFSTAEGVVLGALVVFLVSALIALYVNRSRKRRVDRTFVNAVTVYFFLTTHRT